MCRSTSGVRYLLLLSVWSHTHLPYSRVCIIGSSLSFGRELRARGAGSRRVFLVGPGRAYDTAHISLQLYSAAPAIATGRRSADSRVSYIIAELRSPRRMGARARRTNEHRSAKEVGRPISPICTGVAPSRGERACERVRGAVTASGCNTMHPLGRSPHA